MKLSAKETIDAPRAQVWARLTDFDRLEGLAGQHAAIVRTAETPAWRARIDWRGMTRNLDVAVAGRVPEEKLMFAGGGDGIAADVTIRLTEVGVAQTKVDLEVDMRGKSFAGKAIVQTMRVARSSIEERLQKRVSGLAKTLQGT